MTKEKVIDLLDNLIGMTEDNQGNDYDLALKMAIKALEQEPCEDAISRADVKKYLSAPDANGDRVIYEDDLDLLPSVTPAHKKSEWISCKDRLPKDRREVLVTVYWHETYQVMIASYFGDGLWWCVPFNNSGEHMQRLKPKAWMPLPEPYKEKEENADGETNNDKGSDY
jgi:hypothetical protein